MRSSFIVASWVSKLLEDTPRSSSKRWVRIAPDKQCTTGILLAQAVNDEQRASIGRQTGGRVGFFLHTDNFLRDYERFIENGVKFEEEPRRESYGTVAVFNDLYGNRWDLIEYSAA